MATQVVGSINKSLAVKGLVLFVSNETHGCDSSRLWVFLFKSPPIMTKSVEIYKYKV